MLLFLTITSFYVAFPKKIHLMQKNINYIITYFSDLYSLLYIVVVSISKNQLGALNIINYSWPKFHNAHFSVFALASREMNLIISFFFAFYCFDFALGAPRKGVKIRGTTFKPDLKVEQGKCKLIFNKNVSEVKYQ